MILPNLVSVSYLKLINRRNKTVMRSAIMVLPFIFIYFLVITAGVRNLYAWEPRISRTKFSVHLSYYINYLKNNILVPGQCGSREYYVVCGSECKVNCYTSQVGVPCENHGCQRGCFCKGGYLRSGNKGRCIKEKHCPEIRGLNPEKVQNQKKELFKDILIMLGKN